MNSGYERAHLACFEQHILASTTNLFGPNHTLKCELQLRAAVVGVHALVVCPVGGTPGCVGYKPPEGREPLSLIRICARIDL